MPLQQKVAEGDAKAIYRLLHALCIYHIRNHPEAGRLVLSASLRLARNNGTTSLSPLTPNEASQPAEIH